MNEDTRNAYSLSAQNTCNISHSEDGNGHNIEKNLIKKVVVVWVGFGWLHTRSMAVRAREL
jgi:hypothetical protein